jgi:hypothetical protein
MSGAIEQAAGPDESAFPADLLQLVHYHLKAATESPKKAALYLAVVVVPPCAIIWSIGCVAAIILAGIPVWAGVSVGVGGVGATAAAGWAALARWARKLRRAEEDRKAVSSSGGKGGPKES